MSREFTMGIRLNYYDNDFTRGIRDASRHTNGFRDSMAQATRSASGFTSGIGSAAAALVGIVASVGLFKKSIGGAMEMEQTQMQISALVGEAEKGKKMFDMLNDMGLKSTFSESDFLNAGKAFLPITKDLGELNKMLGITERLAASNPLEGMEGAAFSMRELASGDIASIAERFNIGKNDLRNAGFDSAGSAMSNITALDKVLNQYGFTTQYIEKVNKSGAAQWDMMKSNIESATKKAGFAAMDFLKGPLAELNNWMGSGGLAAFTSALSKGLATTVKAAITGGKAIISFTKSVRNGFNQLREYMPIIQTIGYALGVFAVGLGGVKTALMIANAAMRVLSLTMLTSPIGWIILGIGLLIGAFIKLNGGLEGTKKTLQGWGSAVKSFWNSDGTQAWVTRATDAFKQFTAQAVQAFRWVQQQALKYWPAMQAAIVQAFEYVKANVLPVVIEIYKNIGSMYVNIWKAAKPVLTALMTTGVDAFKKIGAAVQPLAMTLGRVFAVVFPVALAAVAGIYKAVTKYLPPVLSFVFKIFQGIFQAVVPVITSIVTSVVRAFTAVLNWALVIWPAVAKIVGWVFTYLQFWWAAIGPFIMAALQVIGGIIAGGFKVIMAVIQFIWTTISSVIQVAWSIISGIITTALGILTGDWEMAWNGFKSIFVGVWDGITDFLGGIGSLFYDSGKAIIETLVNGIKSVAMAPVNAIKNVMEKVREFLPFSDAKKGPLSELTYSGGAIMTTLSKGVWKQQGALQDAVSSAFASTAMGMEFKANATATMNPAPAFAVAPQMAPAASFSATGTNIAPTQVSAVVPPSAKAAPTMPPTINFGDINVHTAEGTDTIALANEVIEQIYRQAKEAVSILSSADKASLLG